MANIDLESLIDREISVLMGGWSAEREISLKTGKAVTDSLRSLDLKVIDIDLKSPDDINKIINSLDLVFIALHGRGGEDGYIQRILEENKIQFTGSGSEACGIAMNKSETKKIWRDLSLPTPDFVEILNAGTSDLETNPFLSGEIDVSTLEESFVVKPAREGSSFGISIVHPSGPISLEDAMKKAIKYDDIIIVEAFVEGEEITVPIVGQKVFTPVTIKPKNSFYDFEAKYLREDTGYLKSDLKPEEIDIIKEFSLNAFQCLGCEGWGRVDLIKDRNNIFQIIEVNTVPGLTETSLVPKSASFEGIDFNNLMIRILNTSCLKS